MHFDKQIAKKKSLNYCILVTKIILNDKAMFNLEIIIANTFHVTILIERKST